MLVVDTIDRTARVGSAVAVTHACGTIPACHGRICVILAWGAASTSRVALALQQAFGVPVGTWGVGENETSSPVTDLLAFPV